MTDYFVSPSGSDAAAGTSWALRRQTLTSIETLLAAGDTVYVGPGVYREMLTCGVSGTAGNIITYIGDVSGAKTDGIGGPVRITGSDDDLAPTRASCITASARSYRTFRGFQFDTTTSTIVTLLTTSGNWVIEDFYFLGHTTNSTCINVVSGVGVTIRRGIILGGRGANIQFSNASTVDNTGHLVENVICIGSTQQHITIARIGGITVRNSLFFGSASASVRVVTALTVGQTLTVTNSVFMCNATAVSSTTAAEFVEDYNCFWGNTTDRTVVNVGTHSVNAPPLFTPPFLLAGFMQTQQSMFGLGEWSTIRALADSGPATDDLYGMTRPATSGKRSWGPIQRADQARSMTQTHAAAPSLKLADAGRTQMLVPVGASSTTISVYVYREASYAGTNPQLIVKQQGQADQTATDAAASGQWNLLTLTFTPAAVPGWAVVEMVSNNTASGASIAVYFDDLTVV